MNANRHAHPIVMVFAGHDPSGGAGIQADIEAIAACSGHAMCIITLLTAQNTQGVRTMQALPPESMSAQIDALLDEYVPQAVKIGALANQEQVKMVADVLARLPEVPVVFDPVLAPSQGRSFIDALGVRAMRECLLPVATLLTPNAQELSQLADGQGRAAALRHLHQEHGCAAILLTSSHIENACRIHDLSFPMKPAVHYTDTNLPREFHGSGCTLSAAIAAFLARGDDLKSAIHAGIGYTRRALARAEAPMNSLANRSFIPRRIS
ncbi:MAG: hydroxymethylpyrimidine/phosphomethylpyrimidine kinase [Candidatus Eutrophobiaceae bacterium]